MPGSREQIKLLLIFNVIERRAAWVTNSLASRMESAWGGWEVVTEGIDYDDALTIAGPMPVVFNDEVTFITQIGQQDNEQEKGNSNNMLNPHDVTARK